MRLWLIAFVFLLAGPVAAQQAQVQAPAPVQSVPGVNAPANVHLDDRGHPIENSRARRGIETGTLGGLGEEGRIAPEYQGSGPDLDTGLRRDGDRRIGAQGPIQKDPPGREWWDPLSGHDNSRPRSTVVGPGSLPGSDDLVSGEDVETIDTGDGGKIVFRHGETSSTEVVYGTDGNVDTVIVTDRESDGSRTETSYSPGDDGSTFIREAHYGQDGEVLYTTESIREATPAGQRTRPNSGYQPDDAGGGGWRRLVQPHHGRGPGHRQAAERESCPTFVRRRGGGRDRARPELRLPEALHRPRDGGGRPGHSPPHRARRRDHRRPAAGARIKGQRPDGRGGASRRASDVIVTVRLKRRHRTIRPGHPSYPAAGRVGRAGSRAGRASGLAGGVHLLVAARPVLPGAGRRWRLLPG